MNITRSIDVYQNTKLVIQDALGSAILDPVMMICYQKVVDGLEDSYKYLRLKTVQMNSI